MEFRNQKTEPGGTPGIGVKSESAPVSEPGLLLGGFVPGEDVLGELEELVVLDLNALFLFKLGQVGLEENVLFFIRRRKNQKPTYCARFIS